MCLIVLFFHLVYPLQINTQGDYIYDYCEDTLQSNSFEQKTILIFQGICHIQELQLICNQQGIIHISGQNIKIKRLIFSDCVFQIQNSSFELEEIFISFQQDSSSNSIVLSKCQFESQQYTILHIKSTKVNAVDYKDNTHFKVSTYFSFDQISTKLYLNQNTWQNCQFQQEIVQEIHHILFINNLFSQCHLQSTLINLATNQQINIENILIKKSTITANHLFELSDSEQIIIKNLLISKSIFEQHPTVLIAKINNSKDVTIKQVILKFCVFNQYLKNQIVSLFKVQSIKNDLNQYQIRDIIISDIVSNAQVISFHVINLNINRLKILELQNLNLDRIETEIHVSLLIEQRARFNKIKISNFVYIGMNNQKSFPSSFLDIYSSVMNLLVQNIYLQNLGLENQFFVFHNEITFEQKYIFIKMESIYVLNSQFQGTFLQVKDNVELNIQLNLVKVQIITSKTNQQVLDIKGDQLYLDGITVHQLQTLSVEPTIHLDFYRIIFKNSQVNQFNYISKIQITGGFAVIKTYEFHCDKVIFHTIYLKDDAIFQLSNKDSNLKIKFNNINFMNLKLIKQQMSINKIINCQTKFSSIQALFQNLYFKDCNFQTISGYFLIYSLYSFNYILFDKIQFVTSHQPDISKFINFLANQNGKLQINYFIYREVPSKNSILDPIDFIFIEQFDLHIKDLSIINFINKRLICIQDSSIEVHNLRVESQILDNFIKVALGKSLILRDGKIIGNFERSKLKIEVESIQIQNFEMIGACSNCDLFIELITKRFLVDNFLYSQATLEVNGDDNNNLIINKLSTFSSGAIQFKNMKKVIIDNCQFVDIYSEVTFENVDMVSMKDVIFTKQSGIKLYNSTIFITSTQFYETSETLKSYLSNLKISKVNVIVAKSIDLQQSEITSTDTFFNKIEDFQIQGNLLMVQNTVRNMHITIKETNSINIQQTQFYNSSIKIDKVQLLFFKKTYLKFNRLQLTNVTQIFFQSNFWAYVHTIIHDSHTYFLHHNSTKSQFLIIRFNHKFKSSIFYKNDKFGAINLQEIHLLIINSCLFANNYNQIGGAISYTIMNLQNSKFLLANSQFYHNQAQIAATIKFNSLFPIQFIDLNNSYKGNMAILYANQHASYCTQIEFVIQIPSKNDSYASHIISVFPHNLTFSEIQSGDQSVKIIIRCLDIYYQIVFDQITKPLKIQQTDMEIRLINSDQRGEFIFFTRLVQAASDKPVEMILTGEFLIEKQMELYIKFLFRKCIAGEYLSPDLTCQKCRYGYYSIGTNEKQCEKCNRSMICENGQLIGLTQGYWRESLLKGEILYCSNRPENCNGNLENHFCQEGYMGPLCESCDYHGEKYDVKYFQNDDFSCQKCEEGKKGNFVLDLLIMMVSSSICYVSYAKSQSASQKLISVHYIKKMELIPCLRFQLQQQLASVYLRIFINYTQVLIFLSRIKKNWMNINKISTVSAPMESYQTFFDCDLQDWFPYVGAIYPRIIFVLILSPIVTVLQIIILGSLKAIYYHEKLVGEKRRLMIFVLYYIQPIVFNLVIQYGFYREVDNKYYIREDIQFAAYNDTHLIILISVIIPSAILWIIMLPAYLLYKVQKYYKIGCNSIDMYLQYGQFYNHYRDVAFFFGFVIMYKTLILMIIFNFYPFNSIQPFLISSCCLLIYAYIFQYYKPFTMHIINDLDKIVTGVLFFSLILSINIVTNPNQTTISEYLLIILNSLLMLEFGFRITFGFLLPFKPMNSKVIDFLIKYESISSLLNGKTRSVNRMRIVMLWKKVLTAMRFNHFFLEKSRKQVKIYFNQSIRQIQCLRRISERNLKEDEYNIRYSYLYLLIIGFPAELTPIKYLRSVLHYHHHIPNYYQSIHYYYQYHTPKQTNVLQPKV